MALHNFTAVAVSAAANAKNSILRCTELAFLREEGGPLAVEGASGRFRSKKPRCKQPSPWDGEGGPRERWMRRGNPLDEIQAVFIAKAAPGVLFCLR